MLHTAETVLNVLVFAAIAAVLSALVHVWWVLRGAGAAPPWREFWQRYSEVTRASTCCEGPSPVLYVVGFFLLLASLSLLQCVILCEDVSVLLSTVSAEALVRGLLVAGLLVLAVIGLWRWLASLPYVQRLRQEGWLDFPGRDFLFDQFSVSQDTRNVRPRLARLYVIAWMALFAGFALGAVDANLHYFYEDVFRAASGR